MKKAVCVKWKLLNGKIKHDYPANFALLFLFNINKNSVIVFSTTRYRTGCLTDFK